MKFDLIKIKINKIIVYQSTGVEEHKTNFHGNDYYQDVLSNHEKEDTDQDFDWENIEILHCESNKCKR